jgi:hypothetical protein
MSKPTTEELKRALNKAVAMKEQGEDTEFVAKTLLNHHYRLGYLEQVLFAADRFMNHGMAEHERMKLLHLIEQAKDAESHTAQTEQHNFGL